MRNCLLVQNGSLKNLGLRKFWPSLKILEVFRSQSHFWVIFHLGVWNFETSVSQSSKVSNFTTLHVQWQIQTLKLNGENNVVVVFFISFTIGMILTIPEFMVMWEWLVLQWILLRT